MTSEVEASSFVMVAGWLPATQVRSAVAVARERGWKMRERRRNDVKVIDFSSTDADCDLVDHCIKEIGIPADCIVDVVRSVQ